MQHSNIGGMQDFRRYQDGERHIKAVRGAKRFLHRHRSLGAARSCIDDRVFTG